MVTLKKDLENKAKECVSIFSKRLTNLCQYFRSWSKLSSTRSWQRKQPWVQRLSHWRRSWKHKQKMNHPSKKSKKMAKTGNCCNKLIHKKLNSKKKGKRWRRRCLNSRKSMRKPPKSYLMKFCNFKTSWQNLISSQMIVQSNASMTLLV